MSLQNICFSLTNPDLVISQGGAVSIAMSKHYACYHCKHESVQCGCALKCFTACSECRIKCIVHGQFFHFNSVTCTSWQVTSAAVMLHTQLNMSYILLSKCVS